MVRLSGPNEEIDATCCSMLPSCYNLLGEQWPDRSQYQDHLRIYLEWANRFRNLPCLEFERRSLYYSFRTKESGEGDPLRTACRRPNDRNADKGFGY